MNKLDNKFKKLRQENRGALIAYFPIGEPGIDALKMADVYVANGVDVLEIGLPVKNPYLDGKVIGESMERIRESGFTVEKAFEIIKEIYIKHNDIALEIMCYKQIFEEINIETFTELCNNSFIDAVLVADAAINDQEYIKTFLGEDIHCLSFLPFNTDKEYLSYLSENSKGFVFLQATDGATGARKTLTPGLINKIETAKTFIKSTPICVGFGISDEKQCASVKNMGADGVIIGSAVVSSMKLEGIDKCGELLRRCKQNL